MSRTGFAKISKPVRRLAGSFAAVLSLCAGADAAFVSGDLEKWHTVVVEFNGPTRSELDSAPNPFLDYRLQVEFTSASGTVYSVPGFFDGNGSGGASGNVWRVRFTPDEEGLWTYRASFRTGSQVAVSLDPLAGTPTHFDGATGSFTVQPLDPDAPGFRSRGRLEWDGTHYLKFRDGGYWIKMGTNVPENFLGYKGFDNTPSATHDYSTHVQHWQAGDPSWNSPSWPATDDARGIIGALNYLAAQKINSIYFMPMNIGADGKDTWPYASTSIDRNGSSSNDNLHFDVSKLAQWEVVLDHAQRKEIFLHFVLSDKTEENKRELDNATLGVERKLFYREMIARFGHHNALQWNICEEYNLDLPLHPDLIKQFAGYINAVDPYGHPVTVHNHGNTYVSALTPFLGDDRFDVLSVQTWQRPDDIGLAIEYFRTQSQAIGRPLPVYVDESIGVDQIGADEYRKRAMWDSLLSGGGHELFNLMDSSLDDFLPYETYFRHAWYARSFVEDNLPFWDMQPADHLVAGENPLHGGADVLAQPGEIYAIYLPQADGAASLSMEGLAGEFEKLWYNPRTGLFEGGSTVFNASASHALGPPPSSPQEDWTVLIVRVAEPGNSPPIAAHGTLTLDEDTPAPLTLSASDPDGDALSYVVSLTPSHGDLSGSVPNLTYTPDANYAGDDQVAFQVSDGRGGNDLGIVEITVEPVNDAPVAEDVAASTFEGEAVVVVLAATDVDGDALTLSIVDPPAHGALGSIVAGGVTYTPVPGFGGNDSFTYVAGDGALQSAPATAQLTVVETGGGGVLFADDFERPDFGALGNGWVEIEQSDARAEIASGRLWFADSSDAPLRPLVSRSFPGVSQGRLSWSFEMDWTRVKKENVYALYLQLGSGAQMSAGDLDAGVAVNLVWGRIEGAHETLGHRADGVDAALASAAGSVALHVNVDLDARTFSVAVDGLVAATGLPTPNAGVLDTLRFVAVGVNEASFDGRTFDDVLVTTDGAADPGPGPDPENTAPQAQPASVSLDEDASAALVLSASDADGDPLTYSIAAGPAHGSLSGVPPAVTYTPAADYFGADAFTFEVSDGRGLTDQAVVNLEIAGLNDAPVAADGSADVAAGGSVAVVLSAVDVDSTALDYAIVALPGHGTLSGIADGDDRVTYTPDAGFIGADSFTFTAADGSATSDVATVTVNVGAAPETSVLLFDDFARSDAGVLGAGWTEVEHADAFVTLAGEKLSFARTSDAFLRPAALRSFAPVSQGRLVWSFAMDWTRVATEKEYRLLMQLGSAAAMSPDDADAGVAVALVWSRIAGVHESLGVRSAGVETSMRVVSGPAVVTVEVDVDARTFDVTVNGSVAASGVSLAPGVAVVDTIRFTTLGLNDAYFAGRTFDDVSVVANP